MMTEISVMYGSEKVKPTLAQCIVFVWKKMQGPPRVLPDCIMSNLKIKGGRYFFYFTSR